MMRNALMPLARNGFLFEPMVDRLVTRAFDTPVWSGGAEVKELEDRVEITLDVPGVRPEQIQVGAEHRTLTVKVERDDRGTFTRQYTIGAKYDINAVQAKLELGVLTLALPKAPEALPRQIPITIA